MTRVLLALQALNKHYPDPAVSTRTKSISWKPWLYLRLFYTETALTWEAEHDFWYSNTFLAVALISTIVAIFLITVRIMFSHTLRPYLDPATIAVLSLVTAPALTALVFMVGKYNFWVPLRNPGSSFAFLGALGGRAGAGPVYLPPDPLRRAGLVMMNKYGCCTQGLLFPRSEVPALIAFLQERHDGQTDSMIEEYADREQLNRFALSPQPVQHVGLISSRGNTLVNTQSNWAFWFEDTDPSEVKKSHEEGLKHVDWKAVREVEKTL